MYKQKISKDPQESYLNEFSRDAEYKMNKQNQFCFYIQAVNNPKRKLRRQFHLPRNKLNQG